MKARLLGRGIKNNLAAVFFLLSALTCDCETWTASEEDLLRLRAVEISSLRMADRVGRMEGYSKREVYEMMEMGERAFVSELWSCKMDEEEDPEMVWIYSENG